MKIPVTMHNVHLTVGKTVASVVHGKDSILFRFTDGEVLALTCEELMDGDYTSSSIGATEDVYVEDFDEEQLFASGIITEEAYNVYLDQEAQIQAINQRQIKEYRRRQYLELKAEFEPEAI